MKRYVYIIWLLTVALLCSVALADQGYHRKIVVGSYLTQSDASAALNRIKAELQSHDQIVALQKEHGFELIARPSGAYYIVSVEPGLCNRKKPMIDYV